MTLAAAVELSPATPVVEVLSFGPAPFTNVLAVLGAKYPDMLLEDGGVQFYEGTGRDYVVDRDEDGYALSITSVPGGALSDPGFATATYRAAVWDADDDSQWFNVTAGRVRITVDCGTGAAAATLETQGAASDNGTPYPLGSPLAVPNGTSGTRDIDEPNTFIRVGLSAVTGPVKVVAQEYS